MRSRSRSLLQTLAAVVLVIAAGLILRPGLQDLGVLRPTSLEPVVTVTAATPAQAREGGAVGTNIEPQWFVDRVSPPIEISGHVFVDGRAAASVLVTLSDELVTGGVIPRRTTTSDDQGAFRFTGVARISGSYRVEAYAHDKAPAWTWTAGDVSKDDLELRIRACPAYVYGTVSDASGGAIAGAEAFVEPAPELKVWSDREGRFRLCVNSASARLRVEAAGYGPWLKRIAPTGATRQDISLMPAASVTGRVVTDRERSPVPYALVSLRVTGERYADVAADAAGVFSIPNVSPGAYHIEARSQHRKSKHPMDLSVFASAKTDVTIPIESRTSVAGRVVSASNAPVTRARVTLGYYATSQWTTSVTTDEDGAFRATDVPIGPRVTVKVEDYEVEAPRLLDVPDAGLQGVTIRATAKGQLQVTVMRNGAPVADATVSARGPIESETKTTSTSGLASFRNLPEGTYRLVASAGGDFALKEKVELAKGHETTVALELVAGRQVSGVVVDEHGEPVDGGRVSFTPIGSAEDLGAAALTDAEGRFQGGPLKGPGAYRIKVVRSALELEPKEAFPRVDVSAAGVATPEMLRIVVRAQDRELSGVVVDEAGGPVPDVRITIEQPLRHMAVLGTTFTGNDGAFRVKNLGSGPYAIRANAPSGGEVKTSPVELPHEPVQIRMPPAGSIRGVLRGFSTTPSLMAWSIVGYDWNYHPATIENDRFVVTGLSRGKFHLAAATSTVAAQATVDVDGERPVEVELVASPSRTIHGRTLDFITGKPLPNMSCQPAPLLGGGRSPVIVPGNVFADTEGNFVLENVPSTPLYIWCWTDARYRGGAAQLPPELQGTAADKPAIVWGLDVGGRPLDYQPLGMAFDEDRPFSRAIAQVDRKGAAERSGVRVGDAFESVGDRSLVEVSNGVARAYLAFVLTERKSVPVVVRRGDALVPLTFAIDGTSPAPPERGRN